MTFLIIILILVIVFNVRLSDIIGTLFSLIIGGVLGIVIIILIIAKLMS